MYPPILIKKINPDVRLPERAYPTDSGLDVYAYSIDKYYGDGNDGFLTRGLLDLWKYENSALVLKPGDRVLIGTGIIATVGKGFEIQVRPRSGLALKKGITVLNTPGTIDESYTAPIGVILINHSNVLQEIKYGDKIAQLVVCPVVLSEVKEVVNLPDTARGPGGFGSTK
jgi:dUTP pyrophosphatase